MIIRSPVSKSLGSMFLRKLNAPVSCLAGQGLCLGLSGGGVGAQHSGSGAGCGGGQGHCFGGSGTNRLRCDPSPWGTYRLYMVFSPASQQGQTTLSQK